jgi:hypothetical protein
MAFSAAFLAVLFTNTTLSSTLGTIQAGIALIVTSSTTLRPLFDATIVRWFGLHISSLGRSSNKNNISLPIWGGAEERRRTESGKVTTIGACRIERPAPQTTESEENLATCNRGAC